jgi:hypothetical protein
LRRLEGLQLENGVLSLHGRALLAVTRTVPHRNQWIAGGVLAGILAACVVAACAGALSNLFAVMGQELFNAAILIVAVVMLTWHNVWMARHGKELAGELWAAGKAVVEGTKSLLALAIVVGVAVLREVSEVVLFLYGVLAGGDSGLSVALGGFAGLVLGAGLHADLFRPGEDSDARAVCDHHDPDRAIGRRQGAARADRLHRDAAFGLSGDPGRDLRADAALRFACEGCATGAGLKPFLRLSL